MKSFVEIGSVHHMVDSRGKTHALEIHFFLVNSMIHNHFHQQIKDKHWEKIAWYLNYFDHFVFEIFNMPDLPLLFLAHLTYV